MPGLFRLVSRSIEIGFVVTVVVVPDLVIPRKGYSEGDIGRDEGRWGEEGWNKKGNRDRGMEERVNGGRDKVKALRGGEE